MSAAARKAKKDRLWKDQSGRCHYCQEPMIRSNRHAKRPPKRLATLEHLDDKLSPDRGARAGQRRVVLACFKCNHELARDRYLQLPLEERQRRSGAQPGTGWSNEPEPVHG